ncbi:hypothetical protein AWL63_18165 [Sphingomonas panacis]|uniref:Uncharacterized protein n=1 Tax=Sphingomonas panacis TaxID=1560345 RepID=A0A1B3ZDS8_9SPHN|nr:hypothetical protein AWL63_18165 [Sphingomonas panacis]
MIIALSAWDLITLRTYHCLDTATRWFAAGVGPGGIPVKDLRLGDVAGVSAGEMFRVPNFGRYCYYDLYAVMKMFGWAWGDLPRLRLAQEQRDLTAGLANRARLAEQRREALDHAVALRDLHDLEGLTCRVIAGQVGLSASLVQRRIAEVRKIEEMRSLYPLPACVRTLH